MSAVARPEPGTLWIHYKAALYLVIAVAETHEHNGDVDVVYFSFTKKHFVTRPLARDSRDQDSWTDLVVWPDGEERTRFVRIEEMPCLS